MKSFVAFSMVVATTLEFVTAVPALSNRTPPIGLVKPGFALTWLDTFIGIPNTLPSSENWLFDLGTSYPGGAERWGNNEYETYTNSTSNVHITKQETLSITPRLKNGEWTSARIETQRSDFVAKKGGKLFIESKLKLGGADKEVLEGIWPAFWALGSDFRGNYTNWPMATEWDFMEVVSGGNSLYTTLHCGYAPGGPCNEYNGIGNGGSAPFKRGTWHTIGFQVDRSPSGKGNSTWQDESLSWYLNGKQIFNITGKMVGDEPTWVKTAHEEHFLLLNVAVGGYFPGFPNNQTIDGPSAGMEVDYVGVWNSL